MTAERRRLEIAIAQPSLVRVPRRETRDSSLRGVAVTRIKCLILASPAPERLSLAGLPAQLTIASSRKPLRDSRTSLKMRLSWPRTRSQSVLLRALGFMYTCRERAGPARADRIGRCSTRTLPLAAEHQEPDMGRGHVEMLAASQTFLMAAHAMRGATHQGY